MARVYANVNQEMPRAYWDYDSVNISWGVLENYEVVRKIGTVSTLPKIFESRSLTASNFRAGKVLRGI